MTPVVRVGQTRVAIGVGSCRETGTRIGDTVSKATRRRVTRRTPIAAALVTFALLLSALALLSTPPARAGTMGFDARPLPGSPNAELGFFKFDADPGAAVRRVLVLTNRTDKAKVIRVAPCDGLAATFGGVAYSDGDKKPQAVGGWIQLSRTSVEIPAESSVEVPFAVKVPAEVTTGVHLGGISMWEPAAATTSGSGEAGGDQATTKITMVTRMVLTVLVTTPGPAVPELNISGVTAEARPDGMYLLVSIANRGTGPTKGEGDIALEDGSFTEKIDLGDMIPDSSTDYPVKWKTDPAEGSYPATVEIRYADGEKVATWSGAVTLGSVQKKALENRLVGDPEGGLPWGLIGWIVLGVIGAGVLLLGGILLGRPRQRSA